MMRLDPTQAQEDPRNSEVDLRISSMRTNNNIKTKTANAEDQISKVKASKRELKVPISTIKTFTGKDNKAEIAFLIMCI